MIWENGIENDIIDTLFSGRKNVFPAQLLRARDLKHVVLRANLLHRKLLKNGVLGRKK